MNERLKKIRLETGLSQEEFGKKIGIESRGHISALEKGMKNITDRIIKDVCREFGISEKWLRYNEGDMKIEDCKDNRYLSNVGKLQRADDETIMRWVNAIAETDPKVLKQIEEFMKKLLEIQED